MLLAKAASMPIPRPIEHLPQFRPVEFGFDVPGGLSPEHEAFRISLAESLFRQGHSVSSEPTRQSSMIIGFHDIPNDGRSLFDRVEEIEPKVLVASDKYRLPNILKQNYTTVVSVPEDVMAMNKRDMEEAGRMTMLRTGTMKLIFLTPTHIVFHTMEGAASPQLRSHPDAMDDVRNKLVYQAIATGSGSYEPVERGITDEAWSRARMPDYLAAAFRQWGAWGYIDRPYDLRRGALTDERYELAMQLLGYARQAESAGAGVDPRLMMPPGYHMGEASGGVVSSKTGRSAQVNRALVQALLERGIIQSERDLLKISSAAFNLDKRFLDRDETLPVSIVPIFEAALREGRLTLEDFKRYALGIGDQPVGWPSIEFDEIARAILESPDIPVSRHPTRNGWIRDENGPYRIKNARGYMHAHVAVDEIRSKLVRGTNALDIVEYVPANLENFPYASGCGSDMQFEATADAVRRSEGIQDYDSPYSVVFFDYLDHGIGAIATAKPLPGTDFIPDNPFDFLNELVEPYNGAVVLTDQIPQI